MLRKLIGSTFVAAVEFVDTNFANCEINKKLLTIVKVGLVT